MSPYSVYTGIFVSILPFLVGGLVLSCCVTLCCFCHKRCNRRRERCNRRREQNVVSISSVLYNPPPSHLHYQPVPLTSGHSSAPVPSAPPPSYQEATGTGYFNTTQGEMMYSVPQPTDGTTQQPFNPAYCPPRYNYKLY